MYTPNDAGMYQVPLVDFGNRLQDNFGLRVREHPPFGGVSSGVHSDASYHHAGQAIDITDWRNDDIDGVNWRTRTGNLRDRLQGAGVEVIGPGDMKGHETHLHLAAQGGMLNLNENQYNYFYGGKSGGKEATFQRAASAPEVIPATSVADRPAAAQKAKNYSSMSKGQLDAAYDAMRSDPTKARDEGMKMHKAFFKHR